MSQHSDAASLFIEQSSKYLTDEYVPKIVTAIESLTIEQIWWRPNESSNSIGNLMLHLAGNVRQWIVGGIGGVAISRDRAAEFSSRDPLAASALIEHLRSAVDDACAVLARIDVRTLTERRSIQRFDTNVMGAIYHVVEHFSMHTGQIIYLAKAQSGKDPGFYRLRADGTPEPAWTTKRAFE